MSAARRAGLTLLLAIAATGIGVYLLPGASAVVVTVGALVETAVLLLIVIGEVRRVPAASSGTHRLRPPAGKPAVSRPKDLERLEAAFSWGSYSRGDFDERLRGLFRRVIRYRLLAAQRVDIDAPGQVASELLPAELAWISSGDAWPWQRESLRSAELTRIMNALERL